MIRLTYEQDGVIRKEFEMNDIYVDYIRNYPLQIASGTESLPFPKVNNGSNNLPYLDPAAEAIDEYVVFISASTSIQGVYVPADFRNSSSTTGLSPTYDPSTNINHTPIIFNFASADTAVVALHATGMRTIESDYANFLNVYCFTYFQNPVPGAVACIVKGRTV